ncbi:MAG: flagellin [Clostridiales bacterium]|nr:flagellin [Clostridiales bacterium]
MRLNHNMNSLSAYNVYKKNLNASSSVMGKISSGLKVKSAKDNPNKIGQSDLMKIQIKSLQAAQKNIQDSVSMIQTADGALQEANNILSRMNELAVSAADGTKSENDRLAIQEEIEQLKGNLTDLANNTEFNGIKIIGDERVTNNKYPVFRENQVGTMVGESTRIPIYNVLPSSLKDELGNKISDLDLTSEENASKGINTVKSAVKTVAEIRSKLGAIANRLDSTGDNSEAIEQYTQNAQSRIADADIGEEVVELARTQIINDSSMALIAQSNNLPMNALRILENLRR